MNTKLPQSFENVFTGRPNGVINQHQMHHVVQDKSAFARARAASSQPASIANGTRAHAANTKRTRSQKRHSTKRQTVPLTAWFKPIVAHEIRRMARVENISISAVVAALVEKSLQHTIDMDYYPLLKPVIEQTIRTSLKRMLRQLIWYMVQIAVEGGQTRHLTTNMLGMLGRQQGMTEAKLNTILAQSEQAARAALARRTPQMRELMEELEACLHVSGKEDEHTPNG